MVSPTSILLIITTFTLTNALDNYHHCFTSIHRKSIDNYAPIAVFPEFALNSCMQQCIQSMVNYAGRYCQSFIYETLKHECRIYDHDGMKSPAIMHPAQNVVYYNRTSMTELCGGPQDSANNSPDFPTIRPQHGENQIEFPEEYRPEELRIQENQQHLPSAGTDLDVTGNPLAIKFNEHCATSKGYYVVIGNEIILPPGGNPDSMREYANIEQGDCAKFCSEEKGPDGGEMKCNSINYFPMSMKCQVFSILAEPHGEGQLVENPDVIYAEKFCLPKHRSSCQEDEVFILHVDKKVATEAIEELGAASITACLQACLNSPACASSVFHSDPQKCYLHVESVGRDPSIIEQSEGMVLIENGCFKPRKARVHASKTMRISSSEQRPSPTDEWSEWSSCQFKIKGKTVRTRSRECSNCEDFQVDEC